MNTEAPVQETATLCGPQTPKPFTDAEIETVARLVHEVNRAVCLVNGDDIAPPWESAPDWMKESSINGVKNVANNPLYVDARTNHDNWMKHKLLAGWRYGEKKDAEAKTHPCLLPFHALPASQQIKDDIFLAVVNAWKQRRPTITTII